MDFKAELSELPAFDDHRRAVRSPVSTSAALRGANVRCVVDVRDLSQGGARLCTSDPLMVGSRVLLKLPLVEPIEATVVWVDGLEAGCQFSNPLAGAVFENVRRSAE